LRVIKCARCGEDVFTTGPRTKYCLACATQIRIESQNKRRSKKGKLDPAHTKVITCEICGKEVIVPAKAARARYCPECSSKAYKASTKKYRDKEKNPPVGETVETTCIICNKSFSYEYRGGKRREFCNMCSPNRHDENAGAIEPNYHTGWHKAEKPRKKKKPHVSQIVDLNEAARKAGMSYGRYVAMLAMKKGKEDDIGDKRENHHHP